MVPSRPPPRRRRKKKEKAEDGHNTLLHQRALMLQLVALHLGPSSFSFHIHLHVYIYIHMNYIYTYTCTTSTYTHTTCRALPLAQRVSSCSPWSVLGPAAALVRQLLGRYPHAFRAPCGSAARSCNDFACSCFPALNVWAFSVTSWIISTFPCDRPSPREITSLNEVYSTKFSRPVQLEVNRGRC